MAWDREKERKAAKAWHKGMSLVAVIFGIFWCVVALSMGAGFMLIFGIPFVGLLIYRLVMVSRHGKEEHKAPPRQETDHWNPRVRSAENGFCPYCGSTVDESFEYCPKCGRKLK